jgi:hypothetical protein
MLAGHWIVRPLHGAVAALRATSTALARLADLLDPEPPSPERPPADPAADDTSAPRAATRQRIVTALERARSRYDAVEAAARSRK